MKRSNCPFCRIVEKKLPAKRVYETERVLGFRDANPQAPVHILLIPKKHVTGVSELGRREAGLFAELLTVSNELAGRLNIQDKGYRLVINSGKEGGQTVDHLHVHLLGGRQMTWPPG